MKQRRETPLPSPAPRRRTANPRAFTLLELLIVCAIISILAAMATPNFLEAQTRAKVARVKQDQRIVAGALEAYAVDNNHYPPRAMFPAPQYSFQDCLPRNKSLGDIDTRRRDLARLTTPITYLSILPPDVFQKGIGGVAGGGSPPPERTLAPPNDVLDYWAREIVLPHILHLPTPPCTLRKPDPGWVIVSVGPDGVMGQTGSMGNYAPLATLPDPWPGRRPGIDPVYIDLKGSYKYDYDPTRGTISPGNIYRFQSGATAKDVFQDN